MPKRIEKHMTTKITRKRIFEIIEKTKNEDKISAIYDGFMMVVILASLFPLVFKYDSQVFHMMDKTTV